MARIESGMFLFSRICSNIMATTSMVMSPGSLAIWFGAGASLAAGVASYMLRAGSLMSSFLATVPIWKGFDPVAVLLLAKPTKKRDAKETEPQDKLPQQKADAMFDGE